MVEVIIQALLPGLATAAAAAGASEPFSDHQERLAGRTEAAEVGRDGVERGQRHLRSCRVDPCGVAGHQAAQSIRTLVHPTPVIAVHMTKAAEEAPPNTDLHFAGPKNFDEAAQQIIEELKRKGVLARAIGAIPTFQYSI